MKVAISACLLGHPVRYDGGHKRADALLSALDAHVQWIPFCPEEELGLGVPREPIRIERSIGALRLLGVDSRRDHTAAMQAFASRRVDDLLAQGICAAIFKSRSPSCGLNGVAVHEDDSSTAKGRGFFAAALAAHCGGMPMAEEEELNDPERREAFIEAARRFDKKRL